MFRALLSSLSVACALIANVAFAHHGWSSFDETKPIYLEGVVKSVKWQNPHAELIINISKDATLPAELGTRSAAIPAAVRRDR